MWEKIQIAIIFRKIFLAKYFLQYFQYSLDMPFFDSIHIPILNKSGVKRLNTLGHLDQYMAQHGRIVKQSYCETV